MRKIAGLLAAFILLSACDDGDMTFRTFNFNNDAPVRCNEESTTFFKINGTELLIFDLSLSTDLLNAATPVNEPRIVGVNFTYRNYDGNVNLQNTLCRDVPPVSPSVTEEWDGEGQLAIITTPVYEEEDQDEPGDIDHITGYNHQLTLITATFSKDGEEVTISNINLGTISRNLNFDFDFLTTTNPPASFQNCSGTNTYYRLDGTEALVLTFDPAALPTAPNTVQINLQNSTDQNAVLLRIFSSSIGTSSICGSNPPITPVEKQRWEANQGVLEIVTTQEGGGLRHTLHLKNVSFRDTGSTALYQPLPNADYVIGIINTN